MVPYLFHDIIRIMRRLMQLIVKPEILDSFFRIQWLNLGI